ncbi:MAG: permease [Bacteroidetes bacterium]|nr:MAG: permease [Bacteroidota bacterium]PIE88726.1 MAG: permease [Bacteroidota bacterium]
MKKTDLFILKSYIGPLVMTFFIAVFILLMQFLWKYVDDLVGKGLEWYILAELLFYASATFVPMALPMAILLASLMTMGNLGERYELAALKASGISLRRIMRPLIITTAIIAGVAFFFSNNILPLANLKYQSIFYDVRKQKLALHIEEGVYYHGIDGFVIRVAKKEKDEKTVRGVMIYDHTNGNIIPTLTIADSGYMTLSEDESHLIFSLFNGANYSESAPKKKQEKAPFRKMTFQKEVITFDLSQFALSRTNEDLFRKNYRMLNLQQLRMASDSLRILLDETKENFARSSISRFYFLNRLDSIKAPDSVILSHFPSDELLHNFPEEAQPALLKQAQEVARKSKENITYGLKRIKNQRTNIRKHHVEEHRKFTLSFACLILFFIGAPLGAIIRKGGLGTPLVISVIFFILYHIISTTGQKYVVKGEWMPFFGMWISSFVTLPLGIFLTWKATNDSQLMDAESWTKFYKKLRRKTKR